MSTSYENNKVNWANKANIARESFKEVLASDGHEDSKAQRILTAMAFITAAAGLIFAEISRVGIAPSMMFPLLNHTYVPTCFFAFIVTMLFGTLFFLAALGPAFNIPKHLRTKNIASYPKSLLFSQLILQGTQDQWIKYWQESSHENLQLKLAECYVKEAYLLSEKVKFKVSYMRNGKFIYKLSLGFLGLMVIPVFTMQMNQVYSIAAWIFSLVLIQDLVEWAQSPGRSLSWGNLAFHLVELGFSIFLALQGIVYWIR